MAEKKCITCGKEFTANRKECWECFIKHYCPACHGLLDHETNKCAECDTKENDVLESEKYLEEKAHEYLESVGLREANYQDGGMVEHIAKHCAGFYKEQMEAKTKTILELSNPYPKDIFKAKKYALARVGYESARNDAFNILLNED